MSYVDSNLIPGEEVIYRAKSGGNLGQIVTFAILFAIVYFIFSAVQPITMIQLAVYGALGILALYWVVLRDMSDEFVVTSKRIIDKRGVVGASVDELALDKVERVIVEQSIIGRIVDEGTIQIKGGGWKEKGSWIIKKPNVFKQKVYEAIEAQKQQ